MAAGELSFEEIRAYLVQNGGKVSNREALRHFKRYLTDPTTQDASRAQFKRYVNTLASIRTENNEKCLILRPKYAVNLPSTSPAPSPSSIHDPINSIGIPLSPNPTTYPTSPYNSSPSTPVRQPPPYRPPPPFTPSPAPSPSPSQDNLSLYSSCLSLSQDVAGQSTSVPLAPPRKRSVEPNFQKQQLQDQDEVRNDEELGKENEEPAEGVSGSEKQTISVKERTQKFNRLASVDDELSVSPKTAKSKIPQEKGADEDDGISVTSLEPKKCREWYVTAAKGDYQALSKLASEEPLLVKVKDPFSTVLHWAAKHGNSDIVKLFAGTYKANVNARTNGGYTPLHLAAQYCHDDVFELLIKVYGADFNIADFSGRTPEKYRMLEVTAGQKINHHKLKGRKKQSDKDRFLRIGSLNVRVKKTTEAFSNFLGVGGSGGAIDPISEKVHKGWGSADNVHKDNLMAAPKAYSTKRKQKRVDSTPRTYSNPGTPNQQLRSIPNRNSMPDSDSDTAAGFDSQWQY